MNNTVKHLDNGDFEVLQGEEQDDQTSAEERRLQCGYTPDDLVAMYGEDHR